MKIILLKITNMHCVSCAMNIDGELEDTLGVAESNTNYAKSQTAVTFDPGKISEGKIKEIVNKLGYDTILNS